jgi:hypothetical protein
MIHDVKEARPWTEQLDDVLSLAKQQQLFFVGGAPRSGTTWLQLLLDSHPEICCRGEGLFAKHLAEPLDRLVAERREALAAKNDVLFRNRSGYPLPQPEDADALLGTGVLLALQRQCGGKVCRAIGEKTPENVFLFPRLKRLFPGAKFIGIARDPRDVLTSAWHFFRKLQPGEDETAAKLAFLRNALPALQQGARTMLALLEQYPADCTIVIYEHLRERTTLIAAELFRFLSVAAGDAMVADCVARTSFAALSGGRQAGMARDGAFFRKGVVGDWRSTLTADMNSLVLHELGWMFPRFDWAP